MTLLTSIQNFSLAYVYIVAFYFIHPYESWYDDGLPISKNDYKIVMLDLNHVCSHYDKPVCFLQ